MKEYLIHRGTRQDLKDMEWVGIDVPMWGDSYGITARARLCWDENALYVQLAAREQSIRAENTEPLQEPCEDSCLELFFCPDPGDLRYFNVEYNPVGLLFLGLGTSVHDLVRLYPLDADPFTFESQYTNDGWQISYSIPHSFVRRFFPGYEPYAGLAIRGNFYKCGDKTKDRHFLAWNPVPEQGHTFHAPDSFGRFLFV